MAAGPAAGLPILGDSEAWDRLPPAEEGDGAPLPVWARALADSLPRTTAAMLELDWLQRADSPLDAVLRGKLRWAVARANRCRYTVSQAELDLMHAGLDARAIEALRRDALEEQTEADAAAMAFAQKLTLAGDTVTDEEVRQLIQAYGEKQVVAIVLLVAYANFQDRLILALQLETEPNGPLPPLRVRFAKGDAAAGALAPPRDLPAPDGSLPDVPEQVADSQWQAFNFDVLQSNMTRQRERTGRIRVPAWEEVLQTIPEEQRPNSPLRIRWSLVCRGYQPELAAGWSACMRTFAEESQQDRVFEESLFWVITRTINCFY
jgi:alkylhydroperoxidase family enzyme